MNALTFAIAQAIAANLTGFQAQQFSEHNDERFYLIHQETGTKLFLSRNYYAKGKISISYSAPRVSERWEIAPYNAAMDIYDENNKRQTIPSINVSDSKTPQVIAKDITNRILSESFRLQKLAMERIRTHREALETKEAVIAELKEIAGDCFKGGKGSFSVFKLVDFQLTVTFCAKPPLLFWGRI